MSNTLNRKISGVEASVLPTRSAKENWGTADVVWPKFPINILIKVTTDDGEYGVGEAASQLWYLNETPEQILSVIKLYDQALRGADPTNIALCHHLMLKSYAGGVPGARGARSGVDMALYDLLGKLLGLPVYKLIGGSRHSNLPTMFCMYHQTPDSMAQGCQEAVAAGYRGIKIKVGDRLLGSGWSYDNLVHETKKLKAALEIIPNNIMVDADANQGWWSASITISMLHQFRNNPNLSIEQPLPYDDIQGSAHVRAHGGVPVILDESVWSVEMMVQILQANACDRVVCKLNRVGGFFEAKKLIAVCEAAGIGVSVDTAPYTLLGDTAVFHAAASCNNVFPVDEGHLSMVTVEGRNPFSGGVKFDKGLAYLPDAPGLGVDVDWGIAACYGTQPHYSVRA